jgi:hypothetical protein
MRVGSLGIFVLVATASLMSQTFRGSIVGTVTDPSGAVVADATLGVTNVATGLVFTTRTTVDGTYRVPELSVGTYTVRCSVPGFITAAVTGVEVNVGAERRVDIMLMLGQTTETVEVTASAPILTTSEFQGEVVTTHDVENLPLSVRTFSQLLSLTPGVAGTSHQQIGSPGSSGTVPVNGARGRSNRFLLDGTDTDDTYRHDSVINQSGVSGLPATVIPLDAIAEFRVVSDPAAEYGHEAGTVINIVSKSGNNNYQGSLSEYFDNDALVARNYFNQVQQPKAQFHNNQFGGSLGGPLPHDRTFFFLNYEGHRERAGVVHLGCVPLGSAPDGSIDPSQATNPVIAALLARHPWPAPNIGYAVANSTCPNVSVISPSNSRVDSLIAKIDYNANPKNTVGGVYYFGNSDQSFPLALTANGGQLSGFNTVTPTSVHLLSLSYVRVFSPEKTNELRFGANRFSEGFFPEDQAFHPSSIGLNTGPGIADKGLPTIVISGVSQLGATASDPRSRVDTNFQLIDDFHWTMNRHQVKFGFEFRCNAVRHLFNKYFRGRLNFSSVDNFLAGHVDGGFQYSGNSLRHTSENGYGLYIQDSFRVGPELTLNYGLRWDYFGVVREKDNLFSNVTSFDPTSATFTLARVGQLGLTSLYEPDYSNFAPRLSLAWDPLGRSHTVVRAAFAIFYEAQSQDFFLGHLPYAAFFDPGPAYNPVGPSPIFSAPASRGSIVTGVPVYGDSSACNFECDTFTFDRHIRTPYLENYNLTRWVSP